jgi:hypothetical protein
VLPTGQADRLHDLAYPPLTDIEDRGEVAQVLGDAEVGVDRWGLRQISDAPAQRW